MTLKPANYDPRRGEGTSIAEIGPVYAEIELVNYGDIVVSRIEPDRPIRSICKQALVNSEVVELVINNEIKGLLGLRVREKRTVRLPDESLREVEMVGPLEVRFRDHRTFMMAMVLSDAEEISLGRLPKAALGVFTDPESKQLVSIPHRPIKRVA
jgi:hypothetical protein